VPDLGDLLRMLEEVVVAVLDGVLDEDRPLRGQRADVREDRRDRPQDGHSAGAVGDRHLAGVEQGAQRLVHHGHVSALQHHPEHRGGARPGMRPQPDHAVHAHVHGSPPLSTGE